jgi:hypothetical protein
MKEMESYKATMLMSQRYKKFSEKQILNKEPVVFKGRKTEEVVAEKKKADVIPNLSELKPIKESGGFNISKVNAATWKNMHPTTRAKYLSYTVPSQNVISQSSSCRKRSKNLVTREKAETEEMVKQMEKLLLLKRGEYKDQEYTQKVDDALKKTRYRMKLQSKVDEHVRVLHLYNTN